jgi:dTDP-4-dehydrorhamnose 3,5-epimerase
MQFSLSSTCFDGISVVEPFSAEDHRGCFSRLYSKQDLSSSKMDFDIEQVNYSISKIEGTIRGLHFQTKPYSETKLIKVISGVVYDVAVDIRPDSSTFLKAHCIELSSSDSKMVFIPPGFAHGIQALKPFTEVIYFSSCKHIPDHEGIIRWNDPSVNISWPIATPILSEKDKLAPDVCLSWLRSLRHG